MEKRNGLALWEIDDRPPTPVNLETQHIATALGLTRLPDEGGLFRQTWKSEAGSAIYFLLTPEEFSALHRIRTDEIWHFYAGDAVEHVQLDRRGGALRRTRLGSNVLGGDCPQLVVSSGVWQGARIASDIGARGWSLLGCTLAPPWNEREFELGARDTLLRDFPAHADLIRALTR